MTRQELERRTTEARTTAEAKAWRDVLALVDFQRELYGNEFESHVRYSVYGNWQTVAVKG